MKCFLDLFSGIGGFSIGAEWAGLKFDKHYFSEVDDYAIRVYQKRFPDAIPLGDICKIDGYALVADANGERREAGCNTERQHEDNILEVGSATENIEQRNKRERRACEGGGTGWLIAGGFPCQDISVAGKGAGLDGTRSGLWFEYARLIGEIRPRYAIMENVGALTHRGLDRVLGSLAEIGYDAEWQDIRASDVGAPHRRERIWIVAYPNAMREPGSPESRKQLERPAQSYGSSNNWMEAGDNVADPKSSRSRGLYERSRGEGQRTPDAYGSCEAVADAEAPGIVRRHGPFTDAASEVRGRGREETVQWWAAEPDVGRVAHGVPSRVDRLKCLGNSIVPQIADLIFQQSAFDDWRQE